MATRGQVPLSELFRKASFWVEFGRIRASGDEDPATWIFDFGLLHKLSLRAFVAGAPSQQLSMERRISGFQVSFSGSGSAPQKELNHSSAGQAIGAAGVPLPHPPKGASHF